MNAAKAPALLGAPDALVRAVRGTVVTDSLTIAREFGRRHDNVLQSLDSLAADDTISALEFKAAEYLDEQGKPRRMLELTERAALVAMPFIGGRKSRIGQVRLVDAFLAMRAALSERKTVGWGQIRQQASGSYALAAEMLMLRRQAEGKATLPHHYSNEARLLNFAFAGSYDPIDRNTLSAADLSILNCLEIRDRALIAQGMPYAERKAALVAFKADLTAPAIEAAGRQKEMSTEVVCD